MKNQRTMNPKIKSCIDFLDITPHGRRITASNMEADIFSASPAKARNYGFPIHYAISNLHIFRGIF